MDYVKNEQLYTHENNKNNIITCGGIYDEFIAGTR